MKGVVRDWTPLQAGACIGLIRGLELPSGMVLHGCMVFQQAGHRWVNPPSKPRLRNEKVFRGHDGKIAYDPVVSFADRSRQDAFSEMALVALDEYLSNQKAGGQL